MTVGGTAWHLRPVQLRPATGGVRTGVLRVQEQRRQLGEVGRALRARRERQGRRLVKTRNKEKHETNARNISRKGSRAA